MKICYWCVTVSQLSWLLPSCLRRWQLEISTSSQLREKNVCGWEISLVVYEAWGASFNRCDLDSAFDRPRIPIVNVLRKVSVKVQVINTVRFLPHDEMHLHQWQLCFSSTFTLQIFHLMDQSLKSTSRLCWWIVHQPTQEQARAIATNWR